MSLQIKEPAPYQVIQREYRSGYKQDGSTLIPLRIDIDSAFPCDARVRYRVVPLAEAFGAGKDWSDLEFRISDRQITGEAAVPAGAWYRLEIKCLFEDDSIAEASVEPFGVGEVFIIAGQSNADCCSEVLTRIEDPQGRVSAYDIVGDTWKVANDPFPNMEGGGSIWPSMCNLLLPELRVPIGLVNVARNASASWQWLPGEELYEMIADAGKSIGLFRAVLWQQGESDVIENTNAQTYIDRLKLIRSTLADHWDFAPTWLPAKSTLHPYVYSLPEQEATIREAIKRLWDEPGFFAGPDTDTLTEDNRAPLDRGGHFSEIGQRRAGAMWYKAVTELLRQHQ